MKKRIALITVVIMVVTLMTAFTKNLSKQPEDIQSNPSSTKIDENENTPVSILLVGYGWFSGIPDGQINNAEMVANALDGEKITSVDGSISAVIHSITVPVQWNKALQPVLEAIEKYNPQIVLGMGTAGGISGLRIEPYGVNWMKGTDSDPQNPDMQIEKNEKIIADGPDYVKGTLPYKDIVIALLENQIPATLGKLTSIDTSAPSTSTTTTSVAPSTSKTTSKVAPAGNVTPITIPYRSSTGMYLCNYMAYMLPYTLSQQTDVMTGFIHLPTQLGYVTQGRLNMLKDLSEEELTKRLTFSLPATMSLDEMVKGIKISLITSLETLNP